MFARQQVAALMGIKDQLDNAGVALVAIGSGSPEQAKKFVASFSFEGEMYVDPSLKTYKAFKLVRGLWRTLGPSSIGRGLSAMKKGFRQGQNAGDLWQQGGMFVIGPSDQIGNQLYFQHRNQTAGDHADLNAVLKACQSA
jgi:hypothetical protein